MNIRSKKKPVKSARSTSSHGRATQDVRSARLDTSELGREDVTNEEEATVAEMEIEYVWNNPCIYIYI